jgi:hypothetical protein
MEPTSNKAEAVLKGQATDIQINKWKEEYKKGIFAVTSEGGHIGYFRNPERGDINAALAAADAEKPMAIIEKLAELLWLGGSDEVLKDDEIFSGVALQLRKKLDGVKAKLVNL